MIDKSLARLDPSKVFHHPDEVVHSQELTLEEKIDILKRWAYEERELEVADEENMQTDIAAYEPKLDLILKALLDLGVRSGETKPPPDEEA